MSKYSEEFKLKVSEKNQAREQEKVIVINELRQKYSLKVKISKYSKKYIDNYLLL